jgi:ribonuclease Z
LKLTFIGTGSGKTSLKRFHSSILLSSSKTNLLIDSGDGISKALLSCAVRFNDIDSILLTHLHADHYAGLPSLITQMKMNKRKNPLTIYLHKSLEETVKNFLLASYVFPERLGFEIDFKPIEANKNVSISDELVFQLFPNSHLAELREFKKYSSLSYFAGSVLFSYKDKKVFYTSDLGSAADLINPEIFGLNLIIIETTHLTPSELEKILTDLSPRSVIFTHISDGQESELKTVQKNLVKKSSIKSFIAKDGQSFKI